jgi:hypothetical integral membrane protein (TIGR02206 family)
MTDDVPPFHIFGVDHLVALALTAAAVAGAARLARRRSPARLLRYGLALLLLSLDAFQIGMGIRGGWLTLDRVLPLQLCDLAVFLAAYALVTLDRRASELLYFWAGSASVLAMLTPELRQGFPRWEFLVFFGLHGLVVVAAATLTFGLGLPPRPGAANRAFVLTAAYAVVVFAVNAVLGTNFMYLAHKPATPTLLDGLGPWPLYLVSGATVAYVLFRLLALPFRGSGPGGASKGEATGRKKRP